MEKRIVIFVWFYSVLTVGYTKIKKCKVGHSHRFIVLLIHTFGYEVLEHGDYLEVSKSHLFVYSKSVIFIQLVPFVFILELIRR